jgi:hypothetical protein
MHFRILFRSMAADPFCGPRKLGSKVRTLPPTFSTLAPLRKLLRQVSKRVGRSPTLIILTAYPANSVQSGTAPCGGWAAGVAHLFGFIFEKVGLPLLFVIAYSPFLRICFSSGEYWL